MIKLFFGLFLASFLFSNGFSFPGEPFRELKNMKGRLSGRVLDAATKKPLQGVNVYIEDIKSGTVTVADGTYQLSNLPEGSLLVEFSHAGFVAQAHQVTIQPGTTLDIEMEESVVENNAVVVTGVSNATQLKKVPFQVSVMRRTDLLRQASNNIIDAITVLPGVTSLTTGPSISKPVIRGLGYQRVLTIHDGVRQEGQQWGDEHGIEIDDASVTKVEVSKGPASVVYGSDAMAGVVNISSNVPLPENTMRANILSGYQSNNRARMLHLNWGGNIRGVSWNVYSTTAAAADYTNVYDGRVLNSKYNQRNAGGYVGYNGSWGYSHLLFSNYDMRTGLVEGERDPDGFFIKPVAGGGLVRASNADFNTTQPLFPYQRIRHRKITSDNSFRLGQGKLNLILGHQRNYREEFGNVDDPYERELFFKLNTLTYTAQYLPAVKNGLSTTFGVNGMRQQNNNAGVEQLIPDYRLFDIGAYAYAKKQFGKLNWSGGLRYDNRSMNASDLLDGTDIKNPGFNRQFSNLSGSVGLAAQLSPQLNVKLNAARAFRAPSIPELASNGAHEGTNRYEYGNIDLRSETSLQFDAGFEFNTLHASFNISGYYNNFNNFIFYRKLANASGTDSLIDVDGETLMAFTFDQRAAILSGMEVTVDIHPHPLDWLHIANTFSFVSGRFREKIENSNFLPFMPAPRLLTELRAQFNHGQGTIRNGYAQLTLDNNFAQDNIFAAYNTETATPGYTLLGLGLGGDVYTKRQQRLFSLYFSATNLTDVAYQHHLSRLKYTAVNEATGRTGVFNMGRNFSIKLLLPLQFPVNLK